MSSLEKALDEIAESDPERLLEIDELANIITNKAKLTEYRYGLTTTLRHGERESKKISTPKPEPGESNMHFKVVKLSESLSEMTKNCYDLAEKINQYPSTDPLFDRKTAVLLSNLIILFNNLGEYIRSLTDERYSFSLIEWTGINVNNERYSKGGAASKAGITRKNITKRQAMNDVNAKVFLDSLEGMEHLLENYS